MFTDDERGELISRLLLVLEQNRAGRADDRQKLAEELVDKARDYLKGRYSTAKRGGPPGVVRSNDIPD
jgi:hypothetical protein